MVGRRYRHAGSTGVFDHGSEARMTSGASVVGLDFDASVAWPTYDWMGVAKAALESTARYLARDLGPEGIRVNLVAAGPIRTMAAKSIPGFDEFEKVWQERAPLGWDLPTSLRPRVPCVVVTVVCGDDGEIVHVDGGVHSQGLKPRLPEEG